MLLLLCIFVLPFFVNDTMWNERWIGSVSLNYILSQSKHSSNLSLCLLGSAPAFFHVLLFTVSTSFMSLDRSQGRKATFEICDSSHSHLSVSCLFFRIWCPYDRKLVRVPPTKGAIVRSFQSSVQLKDWLIGVDLKQERRMWNDWEHCQSINCVEHGYQRESTVLL